MRSVDLIGKALHISRLPEGKKGYKLGLRDKIVEGLVGYIPKAAGKSAKQDSELRLLSIKVL
jgi:hypothetical protein